MISSEERIVRPYVGLERIQHILDGFSLQVGSDVVASGSKLTLSPAEFLSRPVHLVFAGDGAPIEDVRLQLSEGVAEADLDPDDVELLIVLSTTRLRLAEIVWRLPVSDVAQLSMRAEIAAGGTEGRRAALQTPFGGCRVELFLSLRRYLEAAPLRPWRKGTWLGQVTFEIGTDLDEIGFTPLPLDDRMRELLQVPVATNRVIRVEGSVIDSDVGDEAIELYVDEHLLAQLNQFPNSPGSRAFQRQLFLDVATSILIHALRTPEIDNFGLDEINGSLLGRLIAAVAGRVPNESAQSRDTRQADHLSTALSDPTRFVAIVEARSRAKEDLSAAFAGASS